MLGEFLRLLQAVEAGRKCEGKECHDIRDVNVDLADVVDVGRQGHPVGNHSSDDWIGDCPECTELEMKENALREAFHAQGIHLPVVVLDDRTNGQTPP